ncbi:dTDP-4-dehydrorhamnose 3,5-epimerase-like enzyme [Dysgonomonas hofstadii]|uniref:dTDP-4-dehydrorhamnose 3,5-epimerase-like enzyme n=1 Tax=Dysgonomonas hofstadii TaxID=637886 RepID=A0A840CQY1_9BACT|nr:FdtA/QdtA family cupin domain-containing protein [Dysgonomonas hofstadii]MBB4034962.1 dTDP-4-dehydrorhamnose 3,5-epimerase-like enzyme [Dysgonomonas hofstadii]
MKRVRIIELPKVIDRRGNLSFIEAGKHIPFNIARSYWIYDVPGGQHRGSHAFKSQHEVIIALSGSFDVVLNDGVEIRTYTLNRSYNALYVPNMVWRSLNNFSTNALCLVIASEPYSEEDYIRNYKQFRKHLSMSVDRSGGVPSLSRPDNPVSGYNTVTDCSLIDFPIIRNRAGNITPVQGMENVPFSIRRVFYIYDIPSGVKRGMHAHKACHEILVATSGSFEVELDDGTNKKSVLLNSPMQGLHIPPGVWAAQKNYSAGVVCLVLASDVYDSEDYIDTYSEFKKYRQHED